MKEQKNITVQIPYNEFQELKVRIKEHIKDLLKAIQKQKKTTESIKKERNVAFYNTREYVYSIDTRDSIFEENVFEDFFIDIETINIKDRIDIDDLVEKQKIEFNEKFEKVQNIAKELRKLHDELLENNKEKEASELKKRALNIFHKYFKRYKP